MKPDYRANQPSCPHLRRWQRYPVDLPVRVIIPKPGAATRVFTPAHGTAVSGGGMALYVDLLLKRDDQIEVEFQTPSDVFPQLVNSLRRLIETAPTVRSFTVEAAETFRIAAGKAA